LYIIDNLLVGLEIDWVARVCCRKIIILGAKRVVYYLALSLREELNHQIPTIIHLGKHCFQSQTRVQTCRDKIIVAELWIELFISL